LLTSPKFLFDNSVASVVTARTHGLLRRFEGFATRMSDSNLSWVFVNSGCGTEFGACSPRLSHCVVDNWWGTNRTPGFCIWQCSEFVVDHFLFWNVTFGVNDADQGSCFWLDGSQLTGTIKNTLFMKVVKRSSHARVIFMMDGGCVVVTHCWFDVPKNKAVNDHPHLIIDNSTQFKSQKNRAAWPPLASAGYQEIVRFRRSMTPFYILCSMLTASALVLGVLAETVFKAPRYDDFPNPLLLRALS
jgi:hypothetical protein